MKNIRQVTSDALREVIRRSGKTRSKFEQDMGFSEGYIYMPLKQGCSFYCIQRICLAEGMSYSDFMKLGEE